MYIALLQDIHSEYIHYVTNLLIYHRSHNKQLHKMLTKKTCKATLGTDTGIDEELDQ